MVTFEELAASRRAWIAEVLEPWCRQASRKDLLRAAAEWNDIAGRVDEQATLWTWAWSRFPALTHPELSGLDETVRVRVELNEGTNAEGYPDSRRSTQGRLMLTGVERNASGVFPEHGPFSIDEIKAVTVLDESPSARPVRDGSLLPASQPLAITTLENEPPRRPGHSAE